MRPQSKGGVGSKKGGGVPDIVAIAKRRHCSVLSVLFRPLKNISKGHCFCCYGVPSEADFHFMESIKAFPTLTTNSS